MCFVTNILPIFAAEPDVEYIPSIRNLGLGVADPAARLEVNGQVMIRGGNPQNGFVLTTDANGLATWEELTVLGSNVSGTVTNATNAVNATNITNGTITNSSFINGTVNGSTLVNSNITNTYDPWTLVYSEDFETTPSGWNDNTRTSCGGHNILGGFNLDGVGASLYKTFDLSAYSHTHVLVSFNYYSLDTWDNEAAIVYIDGLSVWVETPINVSDAGRVALSSCGSGGSSASIDRVLSGEAYIDHTADTVQVSFTSSLDQAAHDESFGVDNVEVWVK